MPIWTLNSKDKSLLKVLATIVCESKYTENIYTSKKVQHEDNHLKKILLTALRLTGNQQLIKYSLTHSYLSHLIFHRQLLPKVFYF